MKNLFQSFEEFNLKKILSILSKSQKQKYYLISFLNFFATLLEVLGLALVFPVVSIILDYEKFKNFIIKYDFLEFLSTYEQDQFVTFVLISLVAFFLAKNVISILINYYKSKVFFSLIASISSTMFNGYLSQDLSFSIKTNSAFITRNIINHPMVFVHHVLQGIYNVIFETIFIISTLILFFIANKVIGTFIILGSLIFFLLFYFTNKSKVEKYGTSLNERFAQRLKVTREAIEGVKDIKLYNKKEFFEKTFSSHNYRIAGLTSILAIRELLPKMILEFLAVFCVSMIVLFFFKSGMSGKEIFPLISLIAAGLIKINPSLSRILSSLQRIRSSMAIVNELNFEIKKFNKIEKNTNIDFDFNEDININNLKFSYEEKIILDNINLSVKSNSIFGIKGKSGSGKTTLLNLIIGFLNPEEGNIQIGKKSILDNVKKWQQSISYVPQKIFLIDDSLKKNIAFEHTDVKIDDKRLIKSVEIAQLKEHFGKNLDLNTVVGETGKRISAGQIQRMGIARALYKEPKILIFDEATSALDKETENKIIEDIIKLKEQGLTILIVSHDIKLFKFCDSYYDLDNKKLVTKK